MHIHICPVEIAAALDVVRGGLPLVKATWCYHVESIKEKINERKDCKDASRDACDGQELEETVEVTECESEKRYHEEV